MVAKHQSNLGPDLISWDPWMETRGFHELRDPSDQQNLELSLLSGRIPLDCPPLDNSMTLAQGTPASLCSALLTANPVFTYQLHKHKRNHSIGP